MIFLDTMALLFFVENSPRLPRALRNEIISTPLVYVSVVSLWEIGIKGHSGRLNIAGNPVTPAEMDRLKQACAEENFTLIAVNENHASVAPFLDGAHKDPFDRLIVAQALERDATLLSSDAALDSLSPVLRRRWN